MKPIKSLLRSSSAAISTVSERIRRAAGLTHVITDDAMILVGGMSRSGTTLLTAVLDAHPQIASGAELLPSRLPSITEALRVLEAALVAVERDFSKVGRYLRQRGDHDLGLFFVRCYRAGVTPEEVHDALAQLEPKLPVGANLLGERLLVAQTVMKYRAGRESVDAYGFKFTSSSLEVAKAYLPNGKILCIIRDPRDVVLSHQKRGFDRTVAEISRTWSIYANRYRQFEERHPDSCCIIRYEDLTRQPRRTLINAFNILPIQLHPEIFEFHRSDSPIHSGFHPNAERLRMSFSTDGIGRGAAELTDHELEIIESICGDELANFGYDNKGLIRTRRLLPLKGTRISGVERKRKAFQFSRKRKFNREDYACLLEPYIKSYEILAIGDYVRETDIGDRNILMIRHDVDHDIENAIRIAEWEADRDIRATYCLLHTAWYYGVLVGNRYRHSDLLIDAIVKLSELGHEINLHNNLVTLALNYDIDPIEILKSELDFYDKIGVPVTGTSTHGDALCRELNFRNWEIFRECCDDKFGGPRVVENVVDGKTLTFALGEHSMIEFGLEYEAYDIGKDIYHTESGGNMRIREKTKARRSFGRSDSEHGSVCGILTHPVWWDFS